VSCRQSSLRKVCSDCRAGGGAGDTTTARVLYVSVAVAARNEVNRAFWGEPLRRSPLRDYLADGGGAQMARSISGTSRTLVTRPYRLFGQMMPLILPQTAQKCFHLWKRVVLLCPINVFGKSHHLEHRRNLVPCS